VPVVNCFHGILTHPLGEIRQAVGLDDHVPLLKCDARDRTSVKHTLVAAVEHSMRYATTPALR
jgi:hypothetical protein